MKLTALAIAMLSLPLIASAQSEPVAPYESTSSVLLRQALNCEAAAGSTIQALQAQVATLTKERDELKPKPETK